MHVYLHMYLLFYNVYNGSINSKKLDSFALTAEREIQTSQHLWRQQSNVTMCYFMELFTTISLHAVWWKHFEHQALECVLQNLEIWWV